MFQAISVSSVFENCKDFLTSLYGHELYPELYQKAATIMEVLTKSHVLSDGNKRCAMKVAELMISYNVHFFLL